MFIRKSQGFLLLLSFVLLLTAAIPYGSGRADAVQTGTGGRIVQIAAGVDHSLALKADGTVVAWGNNSEHQLDVLDDLKATGTVVAIAALRVRPATPGTERSRTPARRRCSHSLETSEGSIGLSAALRTGRSGRRLPLPANRWRS